MSLSTLHDALKAKEVERAATIRRRLGRVPLFDEVWLTWAMAERRHPDYEPQAKRVLVRVIEEVPKLPTLQIKKLADVLAHVHDFQHGSAAREALLDVLGQLRRKEPIVADFNSLPDD